MVRNDPPKEAQIFTMACLAVSVALVVAARESLYKPQNYLLESSLCAPATHTQSSVHLKSGEDELQSLSQFSLRNNQKNKSTEFVTPTIKAVGFFR